MGSGVLLTSNFGFIWQQGERQPLEEQEMRAVLLLWCRFASLHLSPCKPRGVWSIPDPSRPLEQPLPSWKIPAGPSQFSVLRVCPKAAPATCKSLPRQLPQGSFTPRDPGSRLLQGLPTDPFPAQSPSGDAQVGPERLMRGFGGSGGFPGDFLLGTEVNPPIKLVKAALRSGNQRTE